MVDISDFRKEINEIDDKLLELLQRRFDVAKKVGKYKLEKGLPVLDKQRENDIINSIAEKSNFSKDFIEKFFNAIFEESRRLQEEIKK